MVNRFPTLGVLVSTKTKCTKLIFKGKITLLPVAFLMALSIVNLYDLLEYTNGCNHQLIQRLTLMTDCAIKVGV